MRNIILFIICVTVVVRYSEIHLTVNVSLKHEEKMLKEVKMKEQANFSIKLKSFTAFNRAVDKD